MFKDLTALLATILWLYAAFMALGYVALENMPPPV